MPKIEDLSTEEIIDFLRNKDNKKAQTFISEGLFECFKQHKLQICCSKCGSIDLKKHDKTPNGTIRLKCSCGNVFAITKNTIFEGTDFTWSEMITLIDELLHNRTYFDIAEKLKRQQPVVWLLAMKIMDVISHFEKPKLKGNIQVDETYVRENQKGSHNLISLIDDKHDRPKRKHYQASNSGIKGPEFINVVCAVDSFGIAYAKCVSYGVLQKRYLKDLENHIERVDYLCSDDLDIYRKWCSDKGWKHYIEPSGYRKERKARGYISTDNIGRTLTEEERKISNAIAREMYEEGVYPRIENIEQKYSYDDFNTIHYKFNLNLNSVNSLHSDIKEMLYAGNGGVKDAYLPLYLDWLVYKHNFKKQKGVRSFTKKDAEEILIELCKWTLENNYSTTRNELKNRKLDIPTTSHKEALELEKAMRKAREVIVVESPDEYGRAKKFEGYNAPYIFNKYKFFNSIRAKRLNEICKLYGIDAQLKKHKVDALCERDDAQRIIFNEILFANFKSIEEYQEFLNKQPKKRKRGRPKKQLN